MCVTNFYRWITIKAVASGLQTSIFFISQVDFHFLSPDFIMILKGQSMFSASVDEISFATSLFDNLFLLSWNPRPLNTSWIWLKGKGIHNLDIKFK